jgi:hypothetical protein
MNATVELAEKVDELLLVLRKDLEHIEQSNDNLNVLRELVIRRDDCGLNRLLEQIRSQSQEYVENQKLREQLRQQIARILGWPVGEVRLGRLLQSVSVEQRQRVGQLRNELQNLISRLRSEHSSTVILLADLTRFNNMLLNTILETGKACGITYDARGGTSRSGDIAFMNLQF